MSGSLNKVQIIGYLGLPPKAISTKEGFVFYAASIATNERIKKGENWEQVTEWHQLLFFGKVAKACEYLKQGSYVYVEGKLRNNVWSDSEGNQHYQATIVVTKLDFLDKKINDAEAKESLPPISAKQHLATIKALLGDEAFEDNVSF
ncbi:single-stranded DNA-binding protein [Legionella sp. CNM-1927-20]|uniref:single-stranded DNA-binding protein n=1 Tax=Legionella sp. CNM-1927-20 TaxID=3422221 RepID=UPI00403B184A